MNIHHLELFYYVARHGGISRAVRHMPYGIQQPAVSGQILQLEQDLETKLFERQPFRLSADGLELYEFARKFFDDVESVGSRLRGKRTPLFRIAASELVLREYLPPVVGAMKHRQPEARFALRAGSQLQMERWLHEGEIDLAIAAIDSIPPGLEALKLIELPLVLLAPRQSGITSGDHFWRQPRVAEKLICPSPAESVCRVFQKELKNRRVNWPIAIEASSTALVIRYVAQGHGIGVSLDVAELARHPKVRVLPVEGCQGIEIAALWRPPASSQLDLLLDVIRTRAVELEL